MTKKQNTIVFILVGTVCNLVMMLLISFVLIILSALLFSDYIAYAIPVCMIAGIILGMVIYQRAATYIISKFNLTDKLDPLFTGKYGKK